MVLYKKRTGITLQCNGVRKIGSVFINVSNMVVSVSLSILKGDDLMVSTMDWKIVLSRTQSRNPCADTQNFAAHQEHGMDDN